MMLPALPFPSKVSAVILNDKYWSCPPPPGRLEDLVMIQTPLSNGAHPDHDKEDVVTQKLSTYS